MNYAVLQVTKTRKTSRSSSSSENYNIYTFTQVASNSNQKMKRIKNLATPVSLHPLRHVFRITSERE